MASTALPALSLISDKGKLQNTMKAWNPVSNEKQKISDTKKLVS